jgi:hypothetical protein
MVQIRSLLGAMQARGTVSAGEPRIKASGAPEFVILLDCLVTLASDSVR